jgi:hypothetical protein
MKTARSVFVGWAADEYIIARHAVDRLIGPKHRADPVWPTDMASYRDKAKKVWDLGINLPLSAHEPWCNDLIRRWWGQLTHHERIHLKHVPKWLQSP